jgi:hypothetical protein
VPPDGMAVGRDLAPPETSRGPRDAGTVVVTTWDVSTASVESEMPVGEL